MNGPLPSDASLRANAVQFEDAFEEFGFEAMRVLRLFSRDRDWDPRARALTDQYSPANLLNLGR